MHTAQIDTFVEMFEHMNRAKSGKYNAPHKPNGPRQSPAFRYFR